MFGRVIKSFETLPRKHFGSRAFVRFSEGIYKKRTKTFDETTLPRYVKEVLKIKEKCCILDFGGRMGGLWYTVKDFGKITYDVVELPEVVKEGKELNKDVTFFTDFSETRKDYDIVYFRGSFQYIEKWKSFLEDVRKKHPIFIVFDWTPLSMDVKTFIIEQVTPQGKIPYVIHNVDDLTLGGYSRIFFDKFFNHPLPDSGKFPKSEHGWWYYSLVLRRNDEKNPAS